MQESSQARIAEYSHDSNYESDLSLQGGIIGGLIGAVAVIAVVTVLIVSTGEELFIAPRTIASVFFRENAFTGTLPIIVGTVLHIFIGATEGAIFAMITPRLPRPFWIVAGIVFGIASWLVASFVLVPLVAPLMSSTAGYLNILLLGHLAYGFVLGLAGALYGTQLKSGG
ncbi:MAG: hypothetical protein D6737_08055 [Chloroflexi bacterium]|nr:MAG: hypothetical protein D6737_08055 [Chloroflexota bacterium]